MRIGIFPGTFDPIHKGHIAFVQTAITQAGLDRVIVVAEKEPYRKKPHVAWDHRQAMIERATEPLDKVDHDYHFANELADRHTLANMLDVAKKHYEAAEIWFLVGSDVLEHLQRWEDLADDKAYGGFVVALRHDHNKAWVEAQLEAVKKRGLNPKVIVINSPAPDLGSTSVRQQITEGRPVSNLPENVSHYITEHKLYQTD